MLPWGGLVLGLIVMAVAVAVRQMISMRDSRDLIVSDAADRARPTAPA